MGPADPDPDPQHWFSVREIQPMSVDEIVFVVLVHVVNARGVHSEYLRPRGIVHFCNNLVIFTMLT